MQELKDRAERKEFYEWAMFISMFILLSLGIILIIIAIFTELIVMIPGILGGFAFKAMIVFPYNKLKKLANRRDYLNGAGVLLDEFPHLVDRELLNKILDTIRRL